MMAMNCHCRAAVLIGGVVSGLIVMLSFSRVTMMGKAPIAKWCTAGYIPIAGVYRVLLVGILLVRSATNRFTDLHETLLSEAARRRHLLRAARATEATIAKPSFEGDDFGLDVVDDADEAVTTDSGGDTELENVQTIAELEKTQIDPPRPCLSTAASNWLQVTVTPFVFALVSVWQVVAFRRFSDADSVLWAHLIAVATVALVTMPVIFAIDVGFLRQAWWKGAIRLPGSSCSWQRLRFLIGVAIDVVALFIPLVGLVIATSSTGSCEAPDWSHIGGGGFTASASPPPAGSKWPAGLDPLNPSHRRLVMSVFESPFAIAAFTVVPTLVIALRLFLSAIAHLATVRQHQAEAAAETIRNAIAYISHEARGPLNAAVLSLELLVGAPAEGTAEAEDAPGLSRKSLLASLTAGIQASRRHLDDMLLYEQLGNGAAAAVSSSASWGEPDLLWMAHLDEGFESTCRSQDISLNLGWREIVLAAQQLGTAAPPVHVYLRRHGQGRDGIFSVGEPQTRRMGIHEQLVSLGGTLLPPRNEDNTSQVVRFGRDWGLVEAPNLEVETATEGVDSMQSVPSARDGPAPGWAANGAGAAARQRGPGPGSDAHPASGSGLHKSSDYSREHRVSPSPDSDISATAHQPQPASTTPVQVERPTSRQRPSSRQASSGTVIPFAEGLEGAIAFVDHDQVMSVLNNGVSNAIKHAKQGGVIEVAFWTSTEPSLVKSFPEPAHTPTPEDFLAWQRRGEEQAASRHAAASNHAAASSGGVHGGLGRSEDARSASTAHLRSFASRAQRAVITIEVRDNGSGIPRALLESGKLFTPFARLRQGDDSLKMASSGLGLAIVRSTVVGSLRGEVGLASQEGTGTVLFARFPAWVKWLERPAGSTLFPSHTESIVHSGRESSRMPPAILATSSMLVSGLGSAPSPAARRALAGPSAFVGASPAHPRAKEEYRRRLRLAALDDLGSGTPTSQPRAVAALDNTDMPRMGWSAPRAKQMPSGLSGTPERQRERGLLHLSQPPPGRGDAIEPARRPLQRDAAGLADPRAALIAAASLGLPVVRGQPTSSGWPNRGGSGAGPPRSPLGQTARTAAAHASAARYLGVSDPARTPGSPLAQRRAVLVRGQDSKPMVASRIDTSDARSDNDPGRLPTGSGTVGTGEPLGDRLTKTRLRSDSGDPPKCSARSLGRDGAGKREQFSAQMTDEERLALEQRPQAAAKPVHARSSPSRASAACPNATSARLSSSDVVGSVANAPSRSDRSRRLSLTAALPDSKPAADEDQAVITTTSAARAARPRRESHGRQVERGSRRRTVAAERGSKEQRAERRSQKQAARREKRRDHSSSRGTLGSATLRADVQGKRVFVVDDERVNRTLLAAVLQRWGLVPSTFAHGQLLIDELTRLQTRPEHEWPLLITLDVEMPVLDGRQVLVHIRRRVRSLREAGEPELAGRLDSLPVVVVTGNARARDREQLERLGAKAVLRKPVDPDELQSTIHAVVRPASPSAGAGSTAAASQPAALPP